MREGRGKPQPPAVRFRASQLRGTEGPDAARRRGAEDAPADPRKDETEGHPLYATARLWDDGVIDPRQTRSVLALALSASLNAPIPDWDAPVFRM